MSSYRNRVGFSRFYESQGVMGFMGGSISLDDHVEDMIKRGILIDPCRMRHEHNYDEDDEDEELSDSEVQWECHQHRFKWDVKKQDFVSHTQKSRTVTTAEINDHQWNLCGLMDSYPDSHEEDSKNIFTQKTFRPDKAAYEDYIAKEEADRKEKLLEEKKEMKAEKKRLKKQRQKERKRLQKELESASTEDKETKDTDKATVDKDEDEPSDDKIEEDGLNLRDMAAALDSDCSDGSSEGSTDEENEGLDLTSCFVTKAAEIVKRQLEQKQDKDKKKSPGKEEEKTPEKLTSEENGAENHVENHVEKKVISTSGPTMEDFIKMSTELAMIGNKQAAAGNFKLAVKYFTDAIKFNPTEYKLFGNRAFCFEKMQEFDKALNDAELSLSMSPGWVKGLFRKGRALAGLKRYEEAANAFKEVIKLDSSCAEANQELVRMQILQLMECGFNQDQCTKALIIHGSVDKAREFLLKFKNQSAAPLPPQQVVNVTGLSPILSAKMSATAAAAPAPPPPAPPPAKDVAKTSPEPVIVVQSHHTIAKPIDYEPSKPNNVTQTPELFPVWVGNISFSATESLISNLFNRVGTVFSLKHLPAKRCAFINFTKQQDCEDAIRRYHGYELLGSRLAVRYPDRMPPGMNISKSAHKAADLAEEYVDPRPTLFPGRNAFNKPVNPNYRYPYKY